MGSTDGTKVPKLRSVKETAAQLNISIHTLNKWRGTSPPRGPAWVRAGRRVAYADDDLREFIASNRHGVRSHAPDPAAAA